MRGNPNSSASSSFSPLLTEHAQKPASLLVQGLVAVLVVAHTTPATAEADPASPVEATLRYSEAEETEEVKCKSGSLLAAVDCVAVRIEGSPEGAGGMSTATLTLALEPSLTVLEDGAFIASIKGSRRDAFGFGGGFLAILGNMKPASKSAVQEETKELRNRLKHWKVSLNEQQIATLLDKGAVDVPVLRPFESLRMLALDNPPTVLTYVYDPTPVSDRPEVKFVARLNGEFQTLGELPYDVPIYVEMEFENDSQGEARTSLVESRGMPALRLRLEKIRPRVFRSVYPFLLEQGENGTTLSILELGV